LNPRPLPCQDADPVPRITRKRFLPLKHALAAREVTHTLLKLHKALTRSGKFPANQRRRPIGSFHSRSRLGYAACNRPGEGEATARGNVRCLQRTNFERAVCLDELTIAGRATLRSNSYSHGSRIPYHLVRSMVLTRAGCRGSRPGPRPLMPRYPTVTTP
jgi:hypothetical protein